MAVSGVVTYRPNRNEIIKGALRLCQAYDFENAAGPTANQITFAAEALNQMVKAWETAGLQLWEKRWAVVFPQPSQGVFALGSPGPAGDHACLTTPLGVGGFVQTTLSADAAAAATTISVESITSESTAGISAVTITDTYNIGIELDDGTLQWTTVSGAPAALVVTLATGLTSAASDGNNVFCYQTKLIRPLRITDGFVRNIPGANDTPCSLIPREWYNRFGYKASTGVPTQMYYDPQAFIGYLYIYPTFSVCDQVLYIEFQKPIDDFVNSTDDFDMPQEWAEALKFNLAMRIAPEYEISDKKFKQIVALAAASYDMIDNWDQENASVYMQANNAVSYPTRL